MADRRVHLTTVLLTVCFTLSYMDRHILSLLVEPVKASLSLTDTQIGLAQGLSFSIFYTAASVPLARLADHGNRPRIMSACIAIWCTMTMLMSTVTGFWQLMLARIGLAASEAGLPPAAMTMMSDINDPQHLARANSFFMLSPFLGGGLALTVGGALYSWVQGWNLDPFSTGFAIEPWRIVFVLVGMPGLIAAAAVLLLREPRPHRQRMPVQKSFEEVKQFLRADAFLFPVFMTAIAMVALLLNGSVAWIPAVMMRAHGITAKTAGVMFGPTFLVAGIVGTLVAGFIISRHSRAVLQRVFRYVRGCVLLTLAPALLGPLAPSLELQLALFAVTLFFASSVLALASLPLLLAAPRAVRAQVLAVQALIAALVGTGLGPTLVGAVSDALSPSVRSLALALAAVGCGAMVLAVLMLQYVVAHAPAVSRRLDEEHDRRDSIDAV